MHSSRLRRGLAVSATFALMSLIVCLVGFGLAIRYRAVAPPTLDARVYAIHILAHPTDYPECPPTTVCPFESTLTPPAYFVVWSTYEPAIAARPYGRFATRLLVMRLQRRAGAILTSYFAQMTAIRGSIRNV